jgi:hypothetical protein
MGRSIGATGILVLTGATSAAAAAGASVMPDFVLDGLQQLLATDPTGATT